MTDRFDWLELGAIDTKAQATMPRTAPNDAPSFHRAGEAMFQSGHFKAAADYYRKAIGMDSRLYPAWMGLIDTLVRAHHLEEADAASKEALDAYKQVRIFYATRALVLGRLGRMQEAWPLSDTSLEKGVENWYALCVRAELLMLEDREFRFESARLYQDAAARVSVAWRPHFFAGWVFLEHELPAMAAGFLAEAAHWNPRAPLCWMMLGDAFKNLRLFEQAQFYYRCAADLEPFNELVMQRQKEVTGLIYGLMRLFQPEDLLKQWKKAVDDMNKQLDLYENDY